MVEEKKSVNVVKMLLKVIVGIILIALGAIAMYYWWPDFLSLLKGIVGIALIVVGLIFFAITKD